MLTIEEKLKKMLLDRGMVEHQCDAVIDSVKADEANKSMKDRWNDVAEGYPNQLFALLWVDTKKYALAYIDEKLPQAWFRPMFAQEQPNDSNQLHP